MFSIPPVLPLGYSSGLASTSVYSTLISSNFHSKTITLVSQIRLIVGLIAVRKLMHKNCTQCMSSKISIRQATSESSLIHSMLNIA